MCLAIPGKIVAIKGKIADVDFGGIRRKTGLDLLPSVKVGNYVIVHAGFAIQVLDAVEAKKRIRICKKINLK